LVKSKGNSSQLQQYSFADISPLSNENYYRLKQVDADGHFTYSNIVYVSFDAARQFQLYPNPVNDILIVKGLSSSGKSTISIIDITGRRIQKVATVNSSYVIDVKKLSPGSYYLQINSNNKITNLKFIKE
jgi:Secretion system C-terminal sorting domain